MKKLLKDPELMTKPKAHILSRLSTKNEALWSRQILQINVLKKPIWYKLGCMGVKILV